MMENDAKGKTPLSETKKFTSGSTVEVVPLVAGANPVVVGGSVVGLVVGVSRGAQR